MTRGANAVPTDARSLRSREALRQALMALVQEKDYEAITVREIAARAEVTFPTFYRQFETKDDLLGDIATDEIHHLASSMISTLGAPDSAASARAICAYVGQNRSLWETLLNTGASAVMREEFIALSRESVKDSGRINPTLPIELTASFVAGAMFELLAWWLRQPEGTPIGLVAQFLEALVLKPATTRHAFVAE